MSTTFAPCPLCNASNAEKLKFTWWGGAIGPKILTHVKCNACGKKYNGKTGKDNTTNIIVYSVVVGVVVFVIFFVFAAVFVMLKMK
jgi:transposase-like protein